MYQTLLKSLPLNSDKTASYICMHHEAFVNLHCACKVYNDVYAYIHELDCIHGVQRVKLNE